jgi:NAD(P)-dependent dehydrogenase (short-subunit alcohol dehydrogenase family)
MVVDISNDRIGQRIRAQIDGLDEQIMLDVVKTGGRAHAKRETVGRRVQRCLHSRSWFAFANRIIALLVGILRPYPPQHPPTLFGRMTSIKQQHPYRGVDRLPGLEGKVAIVTGSTAGIGLAIATVLVQSGCTVVVNGRSAEHCVAACQTIVNATTTTTTNVVVSTDGTEIGASRTMIPMAGDLGTALGVAKFLEDVTAALQGRDVDILVNNIGFFATKDFVEVTDDEWDTYYQVNVMSGVRLSRALLPTMLQRNRGRILFVSSEAGLRTLPLMIPYSVSKAAQIAAARGLAQLTKGSLVTVNSLLPGPTWTEGAKAYLAGYAKDHGLEHYLADDEAALQSYYLSQNEPDSLIQRFLEPTEVAAVAAFLCSDLASSINGTAQRAEGGIIRHL